MYFVLTTTFSKLIHQSELRVPSPALHDGFMRELVALKGPTMLLCTTTMMHFLLFLGVTYSNECMLKVALCNSSDTTLEVAYQGECQEPIIEAVEAEDEEEENCQGKRCTLEIDPICGSDGRVYENPCVFGKHTRT